MTKERDGASSWNRGTAHFKISVQVVLIIIVYIKNSNTFNLAHPKTNIVKKCKLN